MTATIPEQLCNFYNNQFVPLDASADAEKKRYLDVTTPHTGEVISRVPLSSAAEVDAAVSAAAEAFPAWSSRTYKDRAQYIIRFHQALIAHEDELAELVVTEHGKTKDEAIGSVRKGVETVEYAIGLPQIAAGRAAEVSRGVQCQERRDAVGVAVSIVPFNFPIMVPMWTLPIALGCGNTVVLKPSEKVPLTLNRVASIAAEIFPPGVVNLVHGDKDAAQLLIEHPKVRAVTFVGTTAVARHVSSQCRALGKRCLALGGAKNHLVAVPDCNIEMTAQDVVNSFSGCAGQRCMAASVLLLVGEQPELLDLICMKAAALEPGRGSRQVGPVIDAASRDRIVGYINEAEQSGAQILVDGRGWADRPGSWVGPTVILHKSREDRALHDEIFGPVLSIYVCQSAGEAIEIENANPYGNAACIYTSSGAVAEWFTKRFSAGMMGVNIGVPVPREPFSFGGINASSFGDMDITGDGGVEFFTLRKKVTTKWTVPTEKSWLH
ncbi:Aldehyde/histidinol dehydrogenase [Syncephalis pseudoplumigaleata]|uniref:Aldehyde/histidinol dehydrogenase n=1 Tax=Syncephalis pseudoplumigaleata TaxID=1712513 RepID=A0A4P9Z2T7_9FUNG|nr:Aldehyde/histidinol dehydrogenase [Syncephalis pseudoplumigaleata]|eukprot:RKP25790.1 Aldehyde/histidinol dehydrogenase [Syncephalis pseudoplumigaleata]